MSIMPWMLEDNEFSADVADLLVYLLFLHVKRKIEVSY